MYNFHLNNNDITVVATTKIMKFHMELSYKQKGRLKKIEEKPRSKLFVNTGLYILKPKILDLIQKIGFHVIKYRNGL